MRERWKSIRDRARRLLQREEAQAMTEYLVVTVWGLMPLLMVRFPLPISGDGLGRSLIEWMIWGFGQYM